MSGPVSTLVCISAGSRGTVPVSRVSPLTGLFCPTRFIPVYSNTYFWVRCGKTTCVFHSHPPDKLLHTTKVMTSILRPVNKSTPEPLTGQSPLSKQPPASLFLRRTNGGTDKNGGL